MSTFLVVTHSEHDTLSREILTLRYTVNMYVRVKLDKLLHTVDIPKRIMCINISVKVTASFT